MIKEIRKPDKKNVRGFLSPATPPNRFFDLLSMVRIIGALSDENLVLGGILPSTFFLELEKGSTKRSISIYVWTSHHPNRLCSYFQFPANLQDLLPSQVNHLFFFSSNLTRGLLSKLSLHLKLICFVS